MDDNMTCDTYIELAYSVVVVLVEQIAEVTGGGASLLVSPWLWLLLSSSPPAPQDARDRPLIPTIAESDSSIMASGSSPSQPDPEGPPVVHPVIRNALRISLSAKEYKLLHDCAARRAPAAIQTKLPSPTRFEAIVRSKSKHNEASVRASIRVFLLSGAFLKLLDVVLRRLRGEQPPT